MDRKYNVKEDFSCKKVHEHTYNMYIPSVLYTTCTVSLSTINNTQLNEFVLILQKSAVHTVPKMGVY